MAKKKVNPDEPVLGTAAAGDPQNPEAGADTDRFTEPVTDESGAKDDDSADDDGATGPSGESEQQA